MPDPDPTITASTARDEPDPEALRYADAVTELEQILAELEGTEVDVDRLADRVARAAVLIGICRDRIASARSQIDEVLVDLDEAASPELGDASSIPSA